MRRHHVFYALRRNEVLAAGSPGKEEGHRAWIAVYPLIRDRPETDALLRRLKVLVNDSETPVYNVRRFEVDERVLAQGHWLSEANLSDLDEVCAVGDADLEEKLKVFGIDIEMLDRPFKSDFPL